MPVLRIARYIAGVVSLAALLAACTSPLPPQLAQARYQPGYASDFLAQTSWALARWARVGGALRPLHENSKQADRPITITFTHEGSVLRVTGFSGCNNYSTQYTVANGNLIVTGPPLSTRMACSPPERAALEHDFLASLTHIRSTAVDNVGNPRRLTLSLDNGEVLDFARQADPVAGGSAGAVELAYVNARQVAHATGTAAPHPVACALYIDHQSCKP